MRKVPRGAFLFKYRNQEQGGATPQTIPKRREGEERYDRYKQHIHNT